METLVSDQPYVFTPPKDSRFWPWFVGTWVQIYLRRVWGLERIELNGLERFEASRAAGHGILITPNHCRPSDPMSLGMLTKVTGQRLYVMASAHLFRDPGVTRWLLPRLGGFSINREGTDREALKMAIEILATARRPLVVFPEGVITRTNDRIIHLQDGVSFIARSAAKQRASTVPGGRVVVQPVALRYRFMGDLEKSLTPVLDQLEARLSWQPRLGLPLRERIVTLGHALLALKEIEYHGEARTGPVPERLSALVDGVLVPMEHEWLSGRRDGSVIIRVKNLRKALLPELVAGELSEADRARRWKQLFDLEVAQQVFHFPPEYVGENPKPERLIETVERYEEALGNPNPTIHRPMHLAISIGEAIPVEATRNKRVPGDPVMDHVRQSLETMLGLPASQSGERAEAD
jgi:1-acyl-sn-glycerol-3-phosphate acyltransferase